MILIKSHFALKWALKLKRVERTLYPYHSEEEKQRNLFLGYPPEKDHPLSFFWQIEAKRLNSWILHGETMLAIWDILIKEKPRIICEMGSGLSTVLFGKYSVWLEENFHLSTEIYSVEHEQQWADNTAELLSEYNLADKATLVVRPLAPFVQGEPASLTYDLSSFTSSPIDFLLIDGPPTSVGRRFTLPSILGQVKAGGIILLDDAQRQDEFESSMEWASGTKNPITHMGFITAGNGLALLRKN